MWGGSLELSSRIAAAATLESELGVISESLYQNKTEFCDDSVSYLFSRKRQVWQQTRDAALVLQTFQRG